MQKEKISSSFNTTTTLSYTGDAYIYALITFKSNIENDNVLWDFGDGVSSTDQERVHKYKKEGAYSVTYSAGGVTKGL